MILTVDEIVNATKHDYLYVRAPFLEPMRLPVQSVHQKFGTKKAGCKPCLLNAWNKASQQISAAFGRLVLEESKTTPNRLGQLRDAFAVIMAKDIPEMTIKYKIGTEEKELRF